MTQRGHGEGSISQRKDGRWQGSVMVEGHRKYVYGETRREAREKLQRLLAEIQQDPLVMKPQQQKGWRLDAYLNYWLEEVHRITLRPSAYKTYRSQLNAHILPHLGHLPLQKLTAEQVQHFYITLLREERLAPRTIRLNHTILHAAMKYAVKRHWLRYNVCEGLALPRVSRFEIRPLSREEVAHLLKETTDEVLLPLLTLAVTTGMRKGELLALRWRDVDFKRKTLHVQHNVGYIGGFGFVENEPKTAAGRRSIDLPAFVVEQLKAHRLRQKERRWQAGASWQEHDLIFCNNYGEFLHPGTIWQSFKRVLRARGLPDIRFHDLRHSAATILLAMGVPLKVVQEMLGHSSAAITLSIYAHVLPSMQRAAMDQLDDLYRMYS